MIDLVSRGSRKEVEDAKKDKSDNQLQFFILEPNDVRATNCTAIQCLALIIFLFLLALRGLKEVCIYE